MKHAGPDTIAKLHPLLERLRKRILLVERKSGTFYLKSRAFLHFHEDPAGIFADVRLDGAEFTRLRVTTAAEQSMLLTLVDRSLKNSFSRFFARFLSRFRTCCYPARLACVPRI
jgi:hypothetical protein